MSMATDPTSLLRAGRGRAHTLLLPATLLICISLGRTTVAAPPGKPTTETSAAPYKWRMIERVIAQDQGDWQVDYRFKLDGSSVVTLPPAEIGAAIEGWVSNSHVPAHAVPRRSMTRVLGVGTTAFDVITSADCTRSCHERLVVRVWPANGPEPAARVKTTPANAPDPLPAVTINPGGVLCVRLRLEHEHFLYGLYDPMLGERSVELKLGTATLRDTLMLDREHYYAQAKELWAAPSEDRLDTLHFVSAPDSLHLEAHVPGNNYYRFPERNVRYNTKIKLTFWYLIAPGTEGTFCAKLSQYRDSPAGWDILHQGALEERHTKVGRWTKVERIIKTEPECTSLALDFRLSSVEEVGEVWIDDISLVPVGATPERP